MSSNDRKTEDICDEYLIDLNGIRAYKAAYKTCKKDETARTNASILLPNANIKKYIDEQIAKKLHDKALEELSIKLTQDNQHGTKKSVK